jgi:hypothetical protein
MMLITETEIRTYARHVVEYDKKQKNAFNARSPRAILHEYVTTCSDTKSYDVFLTHSIRDAELVLGVKVLLNRYKYTVYVDWSEDPDVDKSKIAKDIADKLRKRMQCAKSLIYITTENVENFKWMPWQLGYFDGLREKVAIMPIKDAILASYHSKEFLSVYPYITRDNALQEDRLLINKDSKNHTSIENWFKTKNSNIRWDCD